MPFCKHPWDGIPFIKAVTICYERYRFRIQADRTQACGRSALTSRRNSWYSVVTIALLKRQRSLILKGPTLYWFALTLPGPEFAA